MIRAVVDTNVSVSALMYGGLPGKLLELAESRDVTIVLSEDLLQELEATLSRKFNVNGWKLDRIRSRLLKFLEVVSTHETIHFIKEDPDDDRVLECAVAGRADFIVSGDKHLLKLGSYEGIEILNPRQFLNLLEKKH